MAIRRQEHAVTIARTGHATLDMDGVLRWPPWADDALCREFPIEMFFPDTGQSAAPAKTICAACDVRAECLEYALAHESGETGISTSYSGIGIYGGMSPNERRKLINNRRDPAA